jgi:hypothetical protein
VWEGLGALFVCDSRGQGCACTSLSLSLSRSLSPLFLPRLLSLFLPPSLPPTLYGAQVTGIQTDHRTQARISLGNTLRESPATGRKDNTRQERQEKVNLSIME